MTFHVDGTPTDDIFLTEEELIDQYMSEHAIYLAGSNFYGELGNNSRVDSNTFIKVNVDGKRVSKVYGADNVLAALTTEGSLYSWGYGTFGLFGNGVNAHRSTPTQVFNQAFRDISISRHQHLVNTDGSLWAFGYNSKGQLGLNSTGANIRTFQQVTVPSTIWLYVASRYEESYAIDTSGDVYTCGNYINESGQSKSRSVFTQIGVVNINRPLQLLCQASTKAVVLQLDPENEDTKMYVYGLATNGQFGDYPNNTFIQNLISFNAANSPFLKKVKKAALGYGDILFLDINGDLGAIGNVKSYSLSSEYVSSIVQISSSHKWRDIATANGATLGITTEGDVYQWGINGDLGSGGSAVLEFPGKRIGFDRKAISVSGHEGVMCVMT